LLGLASSVHDRFRRHRWTCAEQATA